MWLIHPTQWLIYALVNWFIIGLDNGFVCSEEIASKVIVSNFAAIFSSGRWVNTLRPRQNGRHFADDTFKSIFLNEKDGISIKNSLKFVPKGPINNIPVLVQVMAWRRPGDKPLSEPKVVSLLTHICVTRPQRVNSLQCGFHHWLSLPLSLNGTSLSHCSQWHITIHPIR